MNHLVSDYNAYLNGKIIHDIVILVGSFLFVGAMISYEFICDALKGRLNRSWKKIARENPPVVKK